MPARVAEDRHEQVGGAVDHGGQAVETRCAGDEPGDLDDRSDPFQQSQRGTRLRQQVQAAVAGGGTTVVQARS